jgi:hypothetical protein
MTSRRLTVGLGAVVSLLVLAGACSSGSSTGSGATSSTNGAPSTTTTTAAGAVDPNAPETNAAGDIPDNQVFVTYTAPSGDYSLKVPEGWARTEAAGVVTFTDKLNSIRMETTAASAAPTVASASQNEVPAIKAASTNYEAGKVTQVTRKGGAAVLITYRADGPADPVTGRRTHNDVERYEFWKNGSEVILTLSGPQGADNVDPWKIVTDSFAFLR